MKVCGNKSRRKGMDFYLLLWFQVLSDYYFRLMQNGTNKLLPSLGGTNRIELKQLG